MNQYSAFHNLTLRLLLDISSKRPQSATPSKSTSTRWNWRARTGGRTSTGGSTGLWRRTRPTSSTTNPTTGSAWDGRSTWSTRETPSEGRRSLARPLPSSSPSSSRSRGYFERTAGINEGTAAHLRPLSTNAIFLP